MGTAFIYQGSLQDGTNPGTGIYDLEFGLYDAPTNGNQLGPLVTNLATVVSNGTFNATVDFGNVFTGNNCWLQLAVRTNGAAGFTPLNPLQPIDSVPYAIMALGASNLLGTVAAGQVTGSLAVGQLPAVVVTNDENGLSLSGSFTGSGSGLTNVPAATAIAGQLLLQNGMTAVEQINGSSPFDANWTSISLETTPTFTNSPYVSINCGIPTNFFGFGYFTCINGWNATYNGTSDQTPELRVKITTQGTQVGLWLYEQPFWYRSDNTVWTYFNDTTAGNAAYITFAWPNYARHTFEIHLQNPLAAIYIPATNAWVVTPQPKMMGIVIGDSITDGAAGYGGEELWPAQLEDILEPYGINLIPQGEGGTGFIAGGGTAGETNFIFRLTNNVAPFAPNFIIWAGGINDPTNGLYAAMTNCFGMAQSLIPGVQQLVVAPFGDLISSSDEVAANLIASNAAAAYNLPVIFPDISTNSAWITGNRATPGSGNAPNFWSGNGPHPNALGHQFYASQLATFVLTNLLPNTTSAPW